MKKQIKFKNRLVVFFVGMALLFNTFENVVVYMSGFPNRFISYEPSGAQLIYSATLSVFFYLCIYLTNYYNRAYISLLWQLLPVVLLLTTFLPVGLHMIGLAPLPAWNEYFYYYGACLALTLPGIFLLLICELKNAPYSNV